MRRQTLCALAILLSLAMTGAVRAQSEQQQTPPRPSTDGGNRQHQRTYWWNDEKFRGEVGFNLTQAAEIDKIFRTTMEKMKPLRIELDEIDKTIEKMIVAESSDMAVFTHTVEKAEARRAELNKMRTIMLYRFSRVLTPEQNAKFRIAYERREAARKKQDGDRRK